MSRWNDSRTRWLLSALGTTAFVALLLCLPVWSVRNASSTVASITPDTTISTVTVIRHARKQTPPIMKQQIVPVPLLRHAEAIPSPQEEIVEHVDELPADTDDKSAAISDASNTNDMLFPANDAKASATYKSYVLGRIASKKTYPYAARSKGLEGKVRVHLVINPDGTVAHADVIEPSEYALLNDACLAAIQKAAPFKKMTGGMSAMTISFVMDFSLR